jgi:hypothetical protein
MIYKFIICFFVIWLFRAGREVSFLLNFEAQISERNLWRSPSIISARDPSDGFECGNKMDKVL